MPVFVGENPAKKFLDGMAKMGTQLDAWELSDFDALEKLLREVSKTGVTHVQFNPTATGDGSPPPVPIREVIDSLANRPR